MIKVLAIFGIFLAGAFAEPPVRSSYLPPRHRSAPSGQYGAPFNGGFNGFRSSGSSSYLPPHNSLDNGDSATERNNQFDYQPISDVADTYGAPFPGQKSENFASDSITVDSALNTDNSISSRQQLSNYNHPNHYDGSSLEPPASTYDVPKAPSITSEEARAFKRFPNRAGPSSRPVLNGITSAKFGRPSKPSFRSNNFAPSSYSRANQQQVPEVTNRYNSLNTYGTPFDNPVNDNFGARFGGYNALANGNEFSGQFEGYPRKTTTEDPLTEPAVYEYKYEVQASEESGAEFGHRENRENEAARGVYHVLLPDGRMQIVEYQADESGYRPQIRYEEIGYPTGRSGHGGY